MLTASSNDGAYGASFDLARRAFTSIAAINGVSSLTELNHSFREAVKDIGYSLFACVKIIDVSGRASVHLLYGGGLEPWRHHYLQKGYADDDAVLGECLRRTDPYSWNELKESGRIPQKALRIINDAREYNLLDGFVVPLRRLDGAAHAVLLAGRSSTVHDPYVRAVSEFGAITYERLGRPFHALTASPRGSDGVLTPRQKECLLWVRRGKTTVEIAAIIGISQYVVDEYISEACRRLGVHKRTEAAIMAAAKGHLDP